MADILVVGSNMYDLVTYTQKIPRAGETLDAQQFQMGFGGKGANQAIAAAKVGGNVAMLTAIGDDTFGRQTDQNFKDNHVRTDFIHVIKGQSSGIATIMVDETAQNRILIVKGANDYLTKANVDEAFDQLQSIRMVVLQLEIDLNIVYYVIQKAKSLNIPILLNPAPAKKELDLTILSHVDILVPNETELELLAGQPVRTMEEVQIAASKLIETKVANIIVTLGGKGVFYMNKDHQYHIEAPKVKAVDTTGAGDAFIGAFVSQYSQHQEMKKAIEFAVQYASKTTTIKGAQSSYKDANSYDLT